MESNRIEVVEVRVTLGNGDYFKRVVRLPKPRGDNPRFLAQQLDSALNGVNEEMAAFFARYGPQA